MNTLIIVEDGRTQLVLQAETAHERKVLDALSELPNTYRDTFYRARGGWTRPRSADEEQHLFREYNAAQASHEDLVIVFDRKVVEHG